MYKKELLVPLIILTSLVTVAQAFEEISCNAYHAERAYFGTEQRPITIENKTDRILKLVYKNGKQEEFDITKGIPSGKSISIRVFNNATLSVKDLRSGACIQALRLNPEDASEITLVVSAGNILKEIIEQDPATGQDILKIDCNYIKEEYWMPGGSASLSIANKTDSPIAIHRVNSGVGKVGRPLIVIPPSGSQNIFYQTGGRFMLKDKMGQCAGVYEVLGDAILVIDKKELTKKGVPPFTWKENTPTISDNQFPMNFKEVALVTSPRTTLSAGNALKLSGKGDYLLTDIRKIPSKFTLEFVFKANEPSPYSPLEYLVYKADDPQDKSKTGELMAHIQNGGNGTIQLAMTISFMGNMPQNDGIFYDQLEGDNSTREQKIEKISWGVSAIELDPNQYHHIAFVCTGDTMRLFHNGFLEQEEHLLGSTYQPDEITPLIIGGSPKNGMESNATIDEFRIWDRALTSEEILSRRNQALSGDEPGLMHYLDFNLPTSQKDHSNRVIDRVTGDEIGSLVNFKFDDRSNWIDAGPKNWKTNTLQIFERKTSEGNVLFVHEDRRVAALQIDETQYNEIKEAAKSHISNVPAFRLQQQVFEWMPDEYDFLIWYLNERVSLDPERRGICMRVNSKAHNVGFARDDSPFTEGGSPFMGNIVIDGGRMLTGTLHHEICHLWAVGSLFGTEVPVESIKLEGVITNPEVEYGGHWGFTGNNISGTLGGFKQSSLKDLGGNWYQVDRFHTRDGSSRFSDIELYLMGVLPLDSLQTFDLFRGVTDFSLRDFKFRAAERITFTPEKVVELIGLRSPSWEDSQKHFKAMNIVISSRPLTGKEWKRMNRDLELEARQEESTGNGINFWEATRGKATLGFDGLRFKDED